MKKASFLWTRTLSALFLVVFTVSGAWAENITPAEALQLAQDVMQNREASGSRPRKAPGMLQLKATQPVCGLHIFNVADNRTIPILGRLVQHRRPQAQQQSDPAQPLHHEQRKSTG